MMVDTESAVEAHFLCGALNSSAARSLVAAYTVEVSMDTHILENLRVPKFSEKNRIHVRLAELSAAAHKFASSGDQAEVKRIEDQVDRVAAKLWDLTDEELSEIRSSLEEVV